MKALGKLFDTKTKIVVAIVILAILVTWIILFFVARDVAIGLIKPLLWTALIVAASWLAIHFGVKSFRKRKRTEFDEKVAAKEGIDDRRREWATWTSELEKQGIDRYELPFYLLVGEPQSGKSVLLHNSDLHFPFGQNRLSGVGGTRGCDWWFTEEAVILDLAGRLFTHEGGAGDRLEFEAFLQLLYEFRPLCPANGVILVIPSDSLLKDDAEVCGAKATKIQNALLTLTTKLQAQLPVYLVITKGDQIFGFAESVHRLDVDRRHQMFGWSRPADKLDVPFDVAEITAGFEEMVRRARLLRSHMIAGARLPEALPEIDRMYAFPHELQGMQQNLEVYLKRIFTASNITDRVFFRGLYLTSGLQSGVPIAKVCTELFGQSGEADSRNLEALFSKQRAYFIKDLIRNRVFGERGLVRPTQGRVQQTRRSSLVGYGVSGAVVLASVIFAVVYLFKGADTQKTSIYGSALEGGQLALKTPALPIPDLLFRLQQIADAADHEPDAYEKAFTDPRENFKQLYCALFDSRMAPLVHLTALEVVETKLKEPNGIKNHAELRQVCDALVELIGDVDFSSSTTRERILGCLNKFTSGRTTAAGGEALTLERAFERRLACSDSSGLLIPMPKDTGRLQRLARQGVYAVERCLEAGSPTQPGNELGYMLAWNGAQQAREPLMDRDKLAGGRAIELSWSFSRCMATLKRLEDNDLKNGAGGKSVAIKDVFLQSRPLTITYRESLVKFLAKYDSGPALNERWPQMENFIGWASKLFEGHEGAFNLSAVGLHFGSEDFGQTMFQLSESSIGALTGEIIIGEHYTPLKDLDDPSKLLSVCDKSLPADLRKDGLIGLGPRVRELDTRVLGDTASGAPLEVFIAQCLELADNFEKQLPDGEQARLAVVPDGKGPRLSVVLVKELVDLHQSIGKLIQGREIKGDKGEQLRQWQGHIEALLEQHLRKRGPASEWLPPIPTEGTFEAQAWDVLDAFATASRLECVLPQQHPLEATSGDALRSAFDEQANQILDRWAAREPARLDQTVKTVKELGQVALEIARREGLKQSLAGVDFEAWSSRLDSLLHDRLNAVMQEIVRIWHVELETDRTLPVLVSLSEAALESIAKKIKESEQFGMAGIATILEELKEGGPITSWLALPESNAVLVDLRQWKIPARASEVENDQEYKDLKRTLERLGTLGSADGSSLAAEYKDRFAKNASKTPATNAGVRLVRDIRDQFGRRLRDEVRKAYLAELQEQMERSSNRDFFDMLFWEPGLDTSRYRDADMQDWLDKLLKKKGDLSKLTEKYRLTGPDAIGEEIFPAKAPEQEDDWGKVHRFLLGLSEFLLAGDEKGTSIRASKFNVTLIPDVGASESVWALGALPADEKRDFFYYPGNDSSEDLQKQPMGSTMGRLKISNWGFDVSRKDRRFAMLWSKQPMQSGANTDPLAYRYEVPGCLAPLLLAWTGRPLDEDDRSEFQVSFTPKNAKRAAPIRLQFDRPLPLRPAKP